MTFQVTHTSTGSWGRKVPAEGKGEAPLTIITLSSNPSDERFPSERPALENVRYEPGETKNDPELWRRFASA